MASHELKVTRIGNSRGVRLPAATLERYGIRDRVIMEERSDGILLRTAQAGVAKLSWEDTAGQMAAATEDWSEWEVTAPDGTDSLPWSAPRSRRVAEPDAEYGRRGRRTR